MDAHTLDVATAWLVVVAAGCTVWWLAPRASGLQPYGLVVVFASLCLLPVRVLGGGGGFYVGIADLELELRLSTLVVLALASAALLSRRPEVLAWARTMTPFVAWVVLALIFAWMPGAAPLQSGLLQLFVGYAAWLVGARTAVQVSTDAARGRVYGIVVGLLAIQVVVVAAQWLGFGANRITGAAAVGIEGRWNGTFNHPNNLGKAVFVLVLLLLPGLADRRGSTRRLCATGIAMAFVLLLASQGRANFVACTVTVLLWLLLASEEPLRRSRPRVVAIAVACVAAGVYALAARQVEDPGGGVRRRLLASAVELLPEHALWGVGPNRYVLASSASSGSFIPVHNALLLLALELGVIGAVLYLAPFIRCVVQAWRTRRALHSRTVVASLPGLAVIVMTGWGVLGSTMLPLFAFVYGIVGTWAARQAIAAVAQPRTTRIDRPHLDRPHADLRGHAVEAPRPWPNQFEDADVA